MRDLVGTAVRLAPAVARQVVLQGGDDVAFVGTRRQLHGNAVEGALHVVGGGQRLVVDPEDAETALVGHAPQAGEDVLGRQRHAGQHERAPLAVDQRRQPRARLQAVSDGETLRHPRRQRAVGQTAAGGRWHLPGTAAA